MRGSIRQRSKGRCEITIDIGRDPATGKRLRHFESVKGRKADAQKRLAELLVSIEKGTHVKSARDFTLGKYLMKWYGVMLNCTAVLGQRKATVS